jgi:hypothetical protein
MRGYHAPELDPGLMGWVAFSTSGRARSPRSAQAPHQGEARGSASSLRVGHRLWRTRMDESSLRAQSHVLLIAGLVPAIQSSLRPKRLDCRTSPAMRERNSREASRRGTRVPSGSPSFFRAKRSNPVFSSSAPKLDCFVASLLAMTAAGTVTAECVRGMRSVWERPRFPLPSWATAFKHLRGEARPASLPLKGGGRDGEAVRVGVALTRRREDPHRLAARVRLPLKGRAIAFES